MFVLVKEMALVTFLKDFLTDLEKEESLVLMEAAGMVESWLWLWFGNGEWERLGWVEEFEVGVKVGREGCGWRSERERAGNWEVVRSEGREWFTQEEEGSVP